MNSLQEIIGDAPAFIDEILAEVTAEGFDLSDFSQMDHICYRTTSIEHYQEKAAQLATVASLLGESIINNRPISTFRLHEPIVHSGWRVDAVELPAPKADKPFEAGLEHAEFVLYDDFEAFQRKYAGKPFELWSVDRGINPEIGLQLGKHSVKFHMLSLPTVLFLENKLGSINIPGNKQ